MSKKLWRVLKSYTTFPRRVYFLSPLFVNHLSLSPTPTNCSQQYSELHLASQLQWTDFSQYPSSLKDHPIQLYWNYSYQCHQWSPHRGILWPIFTILSQFYILRLQKHRIKLITLSWNTLFTQLLWHTFVCTCFRTSLAIPPQLFLPDNPFLSPLKVRISQFKVEESFLLPFYIQNCITWL